MVLLFALATPLISVAQQKKPNILWILTDDHRADALECFNKATTGKNESVLGYVSSPSLNKVAKNGVIFTNAYCNSPASAPTRTSMIHGQYPHHRGVYGFEYYHNNPDFTVNTFPRILSENGYKTTAFGKMGIRMKEENLTKKSGAAKIFDELLDVKNDFDKHNLCDWTHTGVWTKGKEGSIQIFNYPDGTSYKYYIERKNGKKHAKLTPEDIRIDNEVKKRQDILISYTGVGNSHHTIIGGENTMPTYRTNDGYLTQEFCSYLNHPNQEYKSLGGRALQGPDTKQPQFLYIGYHFPHTPVMPSKSFRDKFKNRKYKVPAFDKEEYDKMPPQMQKWYSKTRVDRMKPEEKQQFIRDYYAFCAMGDSLIGISVERFKKYCKDNNQDYLILMACGDHGWHLGEQGTCAKFAPYDKSGHTAMIIEASDKKAYPAGKIYNNYVEYVDIAPTFLSAAGINIKDKKFDYLDGYNLKDVIAGKTKKRDYVIEEINAVCGPHGSIRCNDFMFGMRTRKDGAIPTMGVDPNTDFKWAMNVSLEEADCCLYDLRVDPLERNNVAYEKAYRELAEWFRKKLGNILLGDRRIECDWKKDNSYNISNFGIGSDDKKLDIPSNLIPKIKK